MRVERANLLKNIPPLVADISTLQHLLEVVNASNACIGNPDPRFHPLVLSRDGKFLNRSGKYILFKQLVYTAHIARIHIIIIINYTGEVVASEECRLTQGNTIRHTECEVIIGAKSKNSRCKVCTNYRANLRSLLSHFNNGTGTDKTLQSSHVNFRHLTKAQKLARMRQIKRKYKNTTKKLQYMKSKLKKAIDDQGVHLSDSTHNDIRSLMEKTSSSSANTNTPFRKIFWNQQLKAASLSDSRQMKWHPLMIKWALYLRHQSNKCYETLRESKCITLPSQRTLRDYTHYLPCNTGFSNEVDKELIRVSGVNTIQDFQKCVCIAIDEMHVKDGLVFNKHTGALVGYVDLGNVNNMLLKFERSIMAPTPSTTGSLSTLQLAKSMLVFFICGLFTKLRFPFAQFPSLSLSGDLIFNPFWECVKRLEWCGFKVLAATADGAKCNRAFFRIHECKEESYKTLNPYTSEKRYIFFFSDPPHLMKTARNCLTSTKRHMWVSKHNS